jgi:uridine phosphorylase
MVVVTFALLQEARVFIRRLTNRRMQQNGVFGLCGDFPVQIFSVGIGGTRLSWLSDSLRTLRPTLLLNSGFAGAARTLLAPGDFLAATNFSSAGLLDRLKCPAMVDAVGEFASISQIADPATKAELGTRSRCLAVDMESAALAKLGEQLGLPVLTVRMISDKTVEAIPALFRGESRRSPRALTEAIFFAVRMLKLTRMLADRLENLLPILARPIE